jgi:hypothetical protein
VKSSCLLIARLHWHDCKQMSIEANKMKMRTETIGVNLSQSESRAARATSAVSKGPANGFLVRPAGTGRSMSDSLRSYSKTAGSLASLEALQGPLVSFDPSPATPLAARLEKLTSEPLWSQERAFAEWGAFAFRRPGQIAFVLPLDTGACEL